MRTPGGGAGLIKGLISTPTRRGLTFVRAKVSKTRLGLRPKTPVAGCAGYGLICGGSRKSIRTAHRIALKVACGSICPYRLAVPEKIFALFVCSIFSTATDSPPRCIRHRRRSAPNPPTPFPDGAKGARMGGQVGTENDALGVVRACKWGGSRGLGRGTMIGRRMSRRPMVMVSGAGGLHRKGGRSPPPKRGRLGGGRCVTDTLLSPSACSTEGFFRRKNAFRIQRSRATGFLGRSPKPFLHPFVGTKGCPRRVGVLITIYKRLIPAEGE